MLITHLYEFFGVLLGCTMYGQGAFPAYGGDTNMYNVHKFMDLNPLQLGYFITQVGLSAASFGVATSDVTAVGMALASLFDVRCPEPASIIPGAPAQDQSICQDASCPLAANATCAANATTNATAPVYANGSTFAVPTSTSGAASTSTSSTKPSSGAAVMAGSSVLGAAALFALGLVL